MTRAQAFVLPPALVLAVWAPPVAAQTPASTDDDAAPVDAPGDVAPADDPPPGDDSPPPAGDEAPDDGPLGEEAPPGDAPPGEAPETEPFPEDDALYALDEADMELTDEELDAAAAELGLEPEELDSLGDGGSEGGDLSLRQIDVAYTPEDLLRVGGSATIVDEAQLGALSYDDPTDVLLQVPGVYIRPEEGFGLRPNIGIRGVAADRSRKITLMEDGVLFGPAPYSAPAAYYFPLMARIVGVEVFKGPAAVLYGPQTVGGSINFLTRDVPPEGGGALDVSYGRFNTLRTHLHWGVMGEHFGLAVEGVHLSTDGFKTIDFADDDTGFQRNEATVTGVYQTDPAANAYHHLALRVGYSTERSNETYLGLTDADFRDDPNRRYAASQRDRFEWWRSQVRLRHRFELGEWLRLTTTAYRHDFDRTWRRLDRFADGTSLFDVLTNPDAPQFADQLAVLRGEEDSIPGNAPGADATQLLVVSNGRRFVSQGIQTRLRTDFDTGPVDHTVEVGLRLHHDTVVRDQPLTRYLMTRGTLVQDGDAFFGSENEGESLAFAAHVGWALSFFGFTATPGVRVEVIGTDFVEQAGDGSNARIERATQTAVLPGLGLTYAITDAFSVLAGVHRGFSPLSPGNVEGVDESGGTVQREPEDSINYELGVRYAVPSTGTLAEVIGFYNDYANLLGTCAGSSGCVAEDVGDQFNAGEARVLGVEVAGVHTFEADDVRFPTRVSYTFTQATFEGEAFTSEFPEWGDVEPGDRIPYVPEHQLRGQLGVAWEWLRVNVGGTYVGRLPEDTDDVLYTDDYFLLDALAGFVIVPGLEVYVRGENLLNQRPIASRRPFGARPIQPLLVMGGIRVDLPGL